MELIVITIVLGIPLLALAGLVAGVVALRRIGELEARIRDLEARPAAPTTPARAPGEEPITEPIPVPEELTAAPPGPPARPAAASRPPAASVPPPVEPPAPRTAAGETARGVEWERWLGLRGAAVAGGALLALAALLLFKYTLDHGLITPALRVVLGISGGVAALLASQWLHDRGQRWAADGLAGGGIVALYAALWASHALYGMLPFAAAGLLLAAVTMVCGLLALVRPSPLVAALGLAGGFATPLLVASPPDRPLALFAYLLLLDAGILALARRRAWHGLATAAVAATTLWQAWWSLGHLDPPDVLLALGLLAAFALLFAAASRSGEAWNTVNAGAVLLPLALAGVLVLRGGIPVSPVPLFVLLAMLCLAGLWIAARGGEDWIGLGAAGAALAVGSAWILGAEAPGVGRWETAGAVAGFAAAVHLGARILRLPRKSLAMADPLVSAGLLAVVALAGAGEAHGALWPRLGVWLVLGGLLVFHGARMDRPRLYAVGAAGPAAALLLAVAADPPGPGGGTGPALLGVSLLLAAVPRAVVLTRGSGPHALWAERGAALAAFLCLPVPVVVAISGAVSPLAAAAGAGVAGVLAAVAAAGLASGRVLLAAVAGTALAQTLIAADWMGHPPGRPPLGWGLGILGLSAVVFTAWPLLAGGDLARRRTAWAAGALAGPLWFPVLHGLWTEGIGDRLVGALPLLLALPPLAVFFAARSRPGDEKLGERAAAWYLGVASCFLATAIPRQLETSWVTVGLALGGLALLLVWRRIPLAGLKWTGLVLLALAAARLLVDPAALARDLRGPLPVLNRLAYTYWVPILALLGGWKILSERERERLVPRELRLTGERPPGVILTGLAAVLVAFVWLNLAVTELFTTGPAAVLAGERFAARDLALSLAWALYAILLLGLGMWRASGGLRWLGLGLLMLTLAKVFLHDLGALTDLYRVGSLLGLAISLLLVSLAYQRFVLRRRPPGEP